MRRGPYKGRKELLARAIELRKSGLGYHTIASILQVSWGTIRHWILDIPIDHQQAHALGMQRHRDRLVPRRFEECLTPATRKQALIRERGHQCEGCKLTHWIERLIPLELHHEDGDKRHNTRSNCKLLCPNCHALTDTYCGRNVGRYDCAAIPTAEEVGSNPAQSQFESEAAHQV